MHIFLTGEKQVGKTTAISSYLNMSGKKADGFVTYWEHTRPGVRQLYLAPFTKSASPDCRLIATDCGQGLALVPDVIEIFETYGKSLLENSGKYDHIIMDELGFIEAGATEFIMSVMKRIEENVPIIGVVRESDTEYLHIIRTHENVLLKEVTIKNREEVLKWLFKRES